MKPHPYTLFVSRFLIWICVVPIMLVSLNYYRDPHHRYRTVVSQTDLEKLSLSGQYVLVVPANYDDRALLSRYVRFLSKPKICVMGGSRILSLSDRMLRPGYRNAFLNCGLTAGTSKDYIAIWQMLKENKKIPETVILCVDFQALNSSSQNELWLSLSPYYEAFYHRRDSLKNKLETIISQIKDLTSFQTTMESLLSFTQPKESATLFSAAAADSRKSSRTSSFALLYPAAYQNRDSELVEREAQINGEGEMKAFRNWNHDDLAGVGGVDALLEDMGAHGTRAVLVLMPYHPRALKVIHGDPVASANIGLFRKRLAEISAKRSVPYYDGYVDSETRLVNGDFVDGVHLKPVALQNFFRRVENTLGLEIFD